jgi:hypothetical protein
MFSDGIDGRRSGSPGRRIVDIEVGVAKDMLVCYHADPTMPL